MISYVSEQSLPDGFAESERKSDLNMDRKMYGFISANKRFHMSRTSHCQMDSQNLTSIWIRKCKDFYAKIFCFINPEQSLPNGFAESELKSDLNMGRKMYGFQLENKRFHKSLSRH